MPITNAAELHVVVSGHLHNLEQVLEGALAELRDGADPVMAVPANDPSEPGFVLRLSVEPQTPGEDGELVVDYETRG